MNDKIWHEWQNLTWMTWFDMNDMIWDEWHNLTWFDMNDMIWDEWHDLTWMTWFDMNDMIWHEWHDLTWMTWFNMNGMIWDELHDFIWMTWFEMNDIILMTSFPWICNESWRHSRGTYLFNKARAKYIFQNFEEAKTTWPRSTGLKKHRRSCSGRASKSWHCAILAKSWGWP
jgi:hypothetical protein